MDGHWSLTLQTVAKEKNECRAMYDAGVNVHHANIEVWDKRLFGILYPGKEKYVSRGTWIQSVVASVDVLGEGNVLPPIVTGIEMSQPHGFTTVDETVRSTASDFNFLMRGVIPRLAHWCIEPHTALADNDPPCWTTLHKLTGPGIKAGNSTTCHSQQDIRWGQENPHSMSTVYSIWDGKP